MTPHPNEVIAEQPLQDQVKTLSKVVQELKYELVELQKEYDQTLAKAKAWEGKCGRIVSELDLEQRTVGSQRLMLKRHLSVIKCQVGLLGLSAFFNLVFLYILMSR